MSFSVAGGNVGLDEVQSKVVIGQDIAYRKWSTFGALVFVVGELLYMVPKDWKYIFIRPFNTVKSIYVFCRVFGVLVLATNVYLVFSPLTRHPLLETTCKQWFTFLLASACTVMAALDVILMLRVYALHHKSSRIGAVLAFLWFSQIIIEVVCSKHTVLGIRYDEICDSSETHPAIMIFAASVWIKHIVLAVLTGMKRNLIKLGAPVVRLVTRDGLIVLGITCALYVTIVSYSFARQVSKAHVVFIWPIALLSVGCCRMIMNFQTLDPTPEPTAESELGNDPNAVCLRPFPTPCLRCRADSGSTNLWMGKALRDDESIVVDLDSGAIRTVLRTSGSTQTS